MNTPVKIFSTQQILRDHITALGDREAQQTFFATSFICENVRNEILDCDDDVRLSKTRNNHRKIHVASELCFGISVAYRNIIDFELKHLISDLLNAEKFKNISKTISQRKKKDLQWNTHFQVEAQRRVTFENSHNNANQREWQLMDSKNNVMKEKNGLLFKYQKHGDEISSIAVSYNEFNTSKNLTELRHDNTTNISKLDTFNLESQGEMLETKQAIQDSLAENENCWSHIINTSINDSDIGTMPEIRAPKNLTEINSNQKLTIEKEIKQEMEVENLEIPKENKFEKSVDLFENSSKIFGSDCNEEYLTMVKNTNSNNLNMSGNINEKSEGFDGWNLSEFESAIITKKKSQPLIIDKQTIIHNYAARALHLNRNIQVERVQVYAGPPKILQHMSALYMMTNPGYKSSPFKYSRNSKINQLFKRQLILEEKPIENFILSSKKTVKSEEVRTVLNKLLPNTEVEELGIKHGMHSLSESRADLAEVSGKLNETVIDVENQGNLNTSLNESLIGLPMYKIFQREIQAPDPEAISLKSLTVARREYYQGEKLEPRKSTFTWCYTASKMPPSKNLREFKYVMEKLENYWQLKYMQDGDKEVKVKDLLLEEGLTLSNYLTLLRILDKLSIHRKLILKYRMNDLTVAPYEWPYVTKKKLERIDVEPKF